MGKLGNFGSRVLVAVVAVPVLLWIVYRDEPVWLWGLAFAASMVAMAELFAMTLSDRTDRVVSTGIGAAAAACFYWLPAPYPAGTVAVVVATLPVMLYYLFRFGDMDTVAARVAHSMGGILYVGFFFTFIALLKRDFGENGGHVIVLLLATAWLSDTGGYFAGKALGKRKLYAQVSPNKTWAGAIGGTLVAAGGAVLIKLYLYQALEWVDVFAMAIPGSILGQLGDLAESLVKRSAGVKDSGAILPGHGGILDRVDAVLFIAPYYYLYGLVRWPL